MFRRRRKSVLTERIREAAWPRSGWRRVVRYVFKRLVRMRGTPYSLAGGFACGAAISFTPFVGLHFAISAVVAWIIRTNMVAAIIGTAVGNPWTFPFIWVWIYNVGVWMGFGEGGANANTQEFSQLFDTTWDALLQFDLVYLLESSGHLWEPMLAGSVPTAIVVWIAIYLPMRSAIETYHDRRRARLERIGMTKN